MIHLLEFELEPKILNKLQHGNLVTGSRGSGAMG